MKCTGEVTLNSAGRGWRGGKKLSHYTFNVAVRGEGGEGGGQALQQFRGEYSLIKG